MELTKNIHSLVTSDSITLYWEMPENTEAACRYQIFTNDKPVGETEHTHYTIKGLSSETNYKIGIKCFHAAQADTECVNHNRTQEIFTLDIMTTKTKEYLDITKEPYCAVGDGQTINTQAIQRAINDCKESQAVYIPQGRFLTGALFLHSDMELFLEEGAVLQGSDRVEDYLPKIPSRFEGTEMECYSSLLNLGHMSHTEGYNCQNILIHGAGTIAGGGVTLAKRIIKTERERLKTYLEQLGDKINEYENASTIPGRARSRLINISNSQNVRICGLTLKDGASWNVHMIYSDRIVTDNCIFYSKGIWNGDGWDPDSSTNCTLFGCTFYTADDMVAIKSGKNPEGNEIARPCSHIRIFDCKCAFGHGIAIGSEMSGGIDDVKIWDCDLENSMNGIEIKATRKRGGYVKNINVQNCIVPRIMVHSVGYNDDGPAAPTPPIFENCSYKNIRVTGLALDEEKEVLRECVPIDLCGFEEPEHYINGVKFQDITIYENPKEEQPASLMNIKYCKNMTFQNVEFKLRSDC